MLQLLARQMTFCFVFRGPFISGVPAHLAACAVCLTCAQVARLQTEHMDDARRHSLDEQATQTSAATAPMHESGDESPDRPRVGQGSCQCSCPPGRGFGYCFQMPELPKNVTPSDETCNIVDTTAPLYCPGVGVPKQCHDPPLESDLDCAAVGEHMHGDVGNPKVWGGILNCTVRSNCTAANGDQRFSAASCECKAWRFGKYGCAWYEKCDVIFTVARGCAATVVARC